MSLLLLFSPSNQKPDSYDPVRLKLTAWRGATFRKRIQFYDGPDTSSGARDLTGYAARLDITNSEGQVVHSLTEDNGGITLGGTAGTLDLYMSADDTAAATWTSGIYELFLIGDDTEIPCRGPFVLKGTPIQAS